MSATRASCRWRGQRARARRIGRGSKGGSPARSPASSPFGTSERPEQTRRQESGTLTRARQFARLDTHPRWQSPGSWEGHRPAPAAPPRRRTGSARLPWGRACFARSVVRLSIPHWRQTLATAESRPAPHHGHLALAAVARSPPVPAGMRRGAPGDVSALSPPDLEDQAEIFMPSLRVPETPAHWAARAESSPALVEPDDAGPRLARRASGRVAALIPVNVKVRYPDDDLAPVGG
jgi:hypothetical protein